MSVPSERIFSKAGEIVNRRRASLKPSWTLDLALDNVTTPVMLSVYCTGFRLNSASHINSVSSSTLLSQAPHRNTSQTWLLRYLNFLGVPTCAQLLWDCMTFHVQEPLWVLKLSLLQVQQRGTVCPSHFVTFHQPPLLNVISRLIFLIVPINNLI